MAVVSSVVSIALRTLARSATCQSFLLTLLTIQLSNWRGVYIRTTLGPRLCDGDFDGPDLPAHLVVAAAQPGLAAALLKELDGQLAAAPGVVGRGALGVEVALEGGGALVDHGGQLRVVDVGERQVEDVAGLRGEGGEESVEEDCVEDAWAHTNMRR